MFTLLFQPKVLNYMKKFLRLDLNLQKLEDWLNSDWESFDLRKNPLTPWLKPFMVDKIKNFETVLNAYYPTASDFKLTAFQKKTMRWISAFRYKANLYQLPYELKVLQNSGFTTASLK